jgi:hypothetical protein
MYSFHCLQRIYVKCLPSSLSPHPWTPRATTSSLTSRPSTLYFRASYTNSLRPHATTCFPSRVQSHIKYPSLHLQLAGDENHSCTPPCSSTSWEMRARDGAPVLSISLYKQQTSVTPGWACRRSTQRTPISWLRLTASSLLTSGEGEGSEPPGTRVARLNLKAPSLVLKPQREGGGKQCLP